MCLEPVLGFYVGVAENAPTGKRALISYVELLDEILRLLTYRLKPCNCNSVLYVLTSMHFIRK